MRVVQHRRVELHELEVRHHRADPVGHGHAVAGRDVGVGRVDVDLAGAAGGEDRRPGGDGADLAVALVEHVRAEARRLAAVAGHVEQVDREVILEDRDVGVALDRGQERSLDLAAADVLVVDHAAPAVAALAGQVERAGGVAIEVGAEREQLLDRGRALGDDALDHLAIAQAIADHQRVGDVLLERVVVGQHRGDAALGPVGVGVAGRALGDDGDPAVGGGVEREGQAGDAGAQDQIVGPRPRRTWGAPYPQGAVAGRRGSGFCAGGWRLIAFYSDAPRPPILAPRLASSSTSALGAPWLLAGPDGRRRDRGRRVGGGAGGRRHLYVDRQRRRHPLHQRHGQGQGQGLEEDHHRDPAQGHQGRRRARRVQGLRRGPGPRHRGPIAITATTPRSRRPRPSTTSPRPSSAR